MSDVCNHEYVPNATCAAMTGTEATTCASLEFTTGVATGADVVVVVVVELLVVVSLICVILKTKRFFFSIFVKREREDLKKKKCGFRQFQKMSK